LGCSGGRERLCVPRLEAHAEPLGEDLRLEARLVLVHRLDLAVGAHVDRGGQRAVGQHDALRPHEPLLREARGAGRGRVVGGRQCEDAVEQRGPRGQCEQHDRREDRRRRGAASPPPRRQPHPRAVTAAQGQAEEVEAAQAVALAARGGTRSGALLGRCFRGVRRRRSARVHAGVPQLGLRAGLGGRVWGTGDKHGPFFVTCSTSHRASGFVRSTGSASTTESTCVSVHKCVRIQVCDRRVYLSVTVCI